MVVVNATTSGNAPLHSTCLQRVDIVYKQSGDTKLVIPPDIREFLPSSILALAILFTNYSVVPAGDAKWHQKLKE